MLIFIHSDALIYLYLCIFCLQDEKSKDNDSNDQEPMEEGAVLEAKDRSETVHQLEIEHQSIILESSEGSAGESLLPISTSTSVVPGKLENGASPGKSKANSIELKVPTPQTLTSVFESTLSSSEPTTSVSEVITNMAKQFVESLVTATNNSPKKNSVGNDSSPSELVIKKGSNVKRTSPRVATTPGSLSSFSYKSGVSVVYLKDTILNGYKIWHFEDPHIWQVLILAILGQLCV